jgi:hypothetical protein
MGIELVACGHIGVVHSDPQNVDGNSRDLHPLLLPHRHGRGLGAACRGTQSMRFKAFYAILL